MIWKHIKSGSKGYDEWPISEEMLSAGRIKKKKLMEQLKDTGLTLGQPKVLDYLKEHDGASQKGIAAGCLIEAGSLTSILNRMEEKDLIERKMLNGNRRTFHIFMTESGKKNQKLVEETPSPAVSEKQRENMIRVITDAVKQIGYVGAGTLEFLLDGAGNFWFMEMNVRLQVEHCVTEILTGIDIVKWQIRIAAGIELNFTQADIRIMGSAIECRINAQNCGKLEFLHIPGGPSVRFDTFLVEGMRVVPFYDSLLGKLIVYAKTREETLRKMRASLCELVIDGIKTNVEEQLCIVEDDRFSSGNYDLTFMGNR